MSELPDMLAPFRTSETDDMALKLMHLQGPTNTGIAANTDEWLEARKDYLSASEIAAVLGVSKYKTWADVKSGEPEVFTEEQLQRFRAGHAFEPVLKQMWADNAEGRTLDPAESTLWTAGDLAATPDGFGDEGGTPCLIEAKCVGHRMLHHWEDGPPLYVLLQVQAQLMCTGRSRCYVVASLGGPGYQEWLVEGHPGLQDLIRDVADAYRDVDIARDGDMCQRNWLRQLDEMGFKQPANKLWPTSDPGLIFQAESYMVDELRRVSQQRQQANQEYDRVVAEIQGRMKDAEFLAVGEDLAATWRGAERRSIDWKKLERMYGKDVLDLARKVTTTRTFLVKNFKEETEPSNIW